MLIFFISQKAKESEGRKECWLKICDTLETVMGLNLQRILFYL